MQRTLGLCVLGWESGGLGSGMLGAGPGTGPVGGRGRGGGQVSVYSCPGGKNQGRLQRSKLSWTGTPGWGWRGNLYASESLARTRALRRLRSAGSGSPGNVHPHDGQSPEEARDVMVPTVALCFSPEVRVSEPGTPLWSF